MNDGGRKFIPLRAVFAIIILAISIAAQSTDQNYPTPVRSGEITGTIKARDIGDARLTSYFYQFDGGQGDLFINIVTRNFTGDIDVFTLTGLRPLTKIVVYADFAESETGRVIYLRQPEKMILRVQGRTPGDDPATFRIKFAGSFVASSMAEPPEGPALPTVTAKNESGVRVNSVGTIVEVIPKPTPTPKAAEIAAGIVDERSDVPESERIPEAEVAKSEPVAKSTPEEEPGEVPAEDPAKRVEVVVTENIPEKTEVSTPPPARRSTRGRRRPPPKETSTTPSADGANPSAENPTAPPRSTPVRDRRGRAAAKPPATQPPDPLANVNLVILFKDGRKVERPMSEVLRFTIDKGSLTVIAKDGSIGRYSIFDVAKVTIE